MDCIFKTSPKLLHQRQNSNEIMSFAIFSTERNIGFAPVPVTPDPNSSSKSIVRGKAIKKTRGREGHFCQPRLNKFVKRLHEMLIRERHSGIVEWRRGLLVLFSTDSFTKKILPKYFNTRKFKTFRRQVCFNTRCQLLSKNV